MIGQLSVGLKTVGCLLAKSAGEYYVASLVWQKVLYPGISRQGCC